MSRSAVRFETPTRPHIGLAVADVERASAFYRALFEREPSKVRSGYARFEVDNPSLNLSLVQSRDARGPVDAISHFGIQVQSTQAVEATRRRLAAMDLETLVEEKVVCCHAEQDKFWVVDPDGHRWEVFVVTDDAPKDVDVAPAGACCDTETQRDSTGKEACC